MNKRLVFGCLTLVVLHGPVEAYAQFTDPRNYENTPAGTDQLEVGYAYLHANASIDTSLVVTGAQFNLHQGVIDYTHYFGWLDRLMWVEASVPLATLDGSISGTTRTELNVTLNPRNWLIVEIAKAFVHRNGPAATGVSVKYDYTWTKSLARKKTDHP